TFFATAKDAGSASPGISARTSTRAVGPKRARESRMAKCVLFISRLWSRGARSGRQFYLGRLGDSAQRFDGPSHGCPPRNKCPGARGRAAPFADRARPPAPGTQRL